MNNPIPPKIPPKTKIFVALSGGVDSAVAALLLKKLGHDVTGVFMKNWSGNNLGISNQCPWKKDFDDAQAVCKSIDIPFKSYNFEKEYREHVISYFFDEYKKGNTPNPDIICNQKIKFGLFLEKAQAEGAKYIATGHYAQKRENKDRTFDLLRAVDSNKDQTYFLSRITQNQLSKALFPIGHLTKPQVRKIALEHNLGVAAKKDSQGICFIGKVDLPEFLKTQIAPKPGDIIDIDTNKKLGQHNGVWFYTLGQRQGIKVGGSDKPYFVAKKDTKNNILYIAKGKTNPALYASQIKLKNLHWINKRVGNGSSCNHTFTGMVRYRQKPQKCFFRDSCITFDKPLWIPAPGQFTVLIRNNIVLGGGIIS